MEERENGKFTLEQLVAIGDAIHNSSTAFILSNTVIERNEDTTKNEAFLCMSGNAHDLIDLLYTALKKDEQMYLIVQEVMTQLALERLRDLTNNKNI